MHLDYLQILPVVSNKSQGWEKIKELAYWLEDLAIEKEVIIFSGSQVNEKGDMREGKDIQNAATINLDIKNHSHDKLKNYQDSNIKYVEKIDGKSVITLSCFKQKFGETFIFDEAFLFNGYVFEEKPISSNENQKVSTNKNKKFNRFDCKD